MTQFWLEVFPPTRLHSWKSSDEKEIRSETNSSCKHATTTCNNKTLFIHGKNISKGKKVYIFAVLDCDAENQLLIPLFKRLRELAV